MKKLKLSGVKKGFLGRRVKKIVATIYIKDGQVVIESKLPSLRALRDRIQKAGETCGFRLSHTREEEGKIRHIHDPDFLEAVSCADLWYGEPFDGWYVMARRNPIVDE